jgi:glyoxylate reductase
MERPRVFVSRRIPESGLALLRAACDVTVWPRDLPPTPIELRDAVRECDGVLSMLSDRFPAGLMAECPRLRVISNYAVGVNNIDLDAAAARHIAVGNTPGVLTDATADLAVALLLAAARHVVTGHANATSGAWRTWEPLGFLGRDLVGVTLGIVGMGRIGCAVAARLRGGWDMRVLYSSREPKPDADQYLPARRVSFETLLAESDVISIHADLNADTVGLFDAAAFAAMKQGAILVNTARGPIVKPDALYDALRSGHLFAAGLDVTDPEPPRADDPLLALPNVVITPHVGSATIGTRDAMARIAAENLLAGLAGRPLPHPVV